MYVYIIIHISFVSRSLAVGSQHHRPQWHSDIWGLIFHVCLSYSVLPITVIHIITTVQNRDQLNLSQLNWVQVGATKCDLNSVLITGQRWTRFSWTEILSSLGQ